MHLRLFLFGMHAFKSNVLSSEMNFSWLSNCLVFKSTFCLTVRNNIVEYLIKMFPMGLRGHFECIYSSVTLLANLFWYQQLLTRHSSLFATSDYARYWLWINNGYYERAGESNAVSTAVVFWIITVADTETVHCQCHLRPQRGSTDVDLHL